MAITMQLQINYNILQSYHNQIIIKSNTISLPCLYHFIPFPSISYHLPPSCHSMRGESHVPQSAHGRASGTCTHCAEYFGLHKTNTSAKQWQGISIIFLIYNIIKIHIKFIKCQ